MPHKLLFLCTGNYYRSRFAEIYFNTLASQTNLPWVAESRGLRLSEGNLGPISKFAVAGLQARDIQVKAPDSFPRLTTEDDLIRADLIIAVKEAEHRPLLIEQFPTWVNQVEYWHIHDLDQASAEDALAQLETQIKDLVARFQRMKKPPVTSDQ